MGFEITQILPPESVWVDWREGLGACIKGSGFLPGPGSGAGGSAGLMSRLYSIHTRSPRARTDGRGAMGRELEPSTYIAITIIGIGIGTSDQRPDRNSLLAWEALLTSSLSNLTSNPSNQSLETQKKNRNHGRLQCCCF